MREGRPGEANSAYKHGHTTGKFSATYHSWASMLQRCTNPNRIYYDRYGGRGITVCQRWASFEAFLADMGERPPGTTLDRFPDRDGNYEPGNCRWATSTQQANNKSSSRDVVLNGDRRTLTEWCRVLGISHNTVRSRMRKWGYTAEEALTAPRQDRRQAALAMTRNRKENRG